MFVKRKKSKKLRENARRSYDIRMLLKSLKKRIRDDFAQEHDPVLEVLRCTEKQNRTFETPLGQFRDFTELSKQCSEWQTGITNFVSLCKNRS